MISPSEKSVRPIYEGNLHIRGGCGSSVDFLDVAAEVRAGVSFSPPIDIRTSV